MAEVPDERLVEAALRGDIDGYMELCRRHYPALVTVAYAILGDRHLAEDAAQEAMAKACRSLPSLVSPASFASWLAAICRTQARDLARRSPRLESLNDRDVPAEVAEPASEIDSIREAISHLPEEAREVVHLRYYGELSYEQMSAVLGISPQAINGRLRRAREAIRDFLVRRTEIGGRQ